MLLPAEIESKTLIPALRAIIAKTLAEKHEIREEIISKMLGVTQAAISNYIRGTRGDPELIKKLMEEKQVSEMVNEICDNLSSDKASDSKTTSPLLNLSLTISIASLISLVFTPYKLYKSSLQVIGR